MKRPQTTENEEQIGGLTEFAVIRTETALSRYPIHRLAKRGAVTIEIRNQGGVLLWEVSHNSKYGQPGPLAYKLDTLIINRRIEECGRPVPKIVRLGSLTEIAQELNLGRNTAPVKTALLQNAFAAINAKVFYRGADGSERTLEAAFTRYSLVLTGESLPDGRRADAVYLLLNEIYWDVLNTAVWRPLDYDYLKTLPPGPQRFYEIVSYQIYSSLRHRRPHARLTYSEYCLLSTQVRYYDWEHVKKQMYKIHAPHLRSGYLAKVEYEAIVDEVGQPDWNMFYLPGPNAVAEFLAFQAGGRPARAARRPSNGPPLPEISGPIAPLDEEGVDLVRQLIAFGVGADTAHNLVQTRRYEAKAQLAYWPERSHARIQDPIGWLIRAIERGHPAPRGYLDQQSVAEVERQTRMRAAVGQARAKHREAFLDTYQAHCRAKEMELEQNAPEAYKAFQEAERGQRRGMQAKGLPLRVWDSPGQHFHRLRSAFPDLLPDFWEWDERINLQGFEKFTEQTVKSVAQSGET